MYRESFANVNEELFPNEELIQEEKDNTVVLSGSTFNMTDVNIESETNQKTTAQIASELITKVEDSISNNSDDDDIDSDREEEYKKLMEMESIRSPEEEEEELKIESSGIKTILIYFTVGLVVTLIIGFIIKYFMDKKN